VEMVQHPNGAAYRAQISEANVGLWQHSADIGRRNFSATIERKAEAGAGQVEGIRTGLQSERPVTIAGVPKARTTSVPGTRSSLNCRQQSGELLEVHERRGFFAISETVRHHESDFHVVGVF